MKQLLFVHQQKHVGGGQSYVDNLRAELSKRADIDLIFYENGKIWPLIKTLFNFKGRDIIWNVYNHRFWRAYVLAKLLGKRNILVVYGVWANEAQSDLLPGLSLPDKLRAYRNILNAYLLQWRFLFLSDVLLHLSVYAKNIFYQIPGFKLLSGKKQAIIYGAADKKDFFSLPKKERQELRQRLGLSKNDVCLLIAGRMEKRKNYLEALEILKDLQQRLPKKNVLLYFVTGFGAVHQNKYQAIFFAECQRLGLGSKVRVFSGLKNQEMNIFYQAADVFLMLSKKFETFGLVNVEALACACPVFSYACCAQEEILTYQPELFISQEIKPSALSNLVYKYLSLSQKKQLALSHELAQQVRQQFSWRKTTNIVMKYLSQK